MPIIVEIPVEIPDGDTCKFPNGEFCRLFRWNQAHEDFPFCRGWGGKQKIKSPYKHQKCLVACHYSKKEQNKN